ncbi:MAG: Rad52/Rad22 family DNA repair protein [Gemmataceae bacterium]
MTATAPDVAEALARPFDPKEIHWKPQAVQGNRALVVPFIDARLVQDRLDEVVGVTGWQDHYEPLPDGSVVCRLQIRVGDEWVTKEDVGGPSEQPDESDRRKAAFSDALKRAAVKFGIGRYLYRLKPQWVAYDPQMRQILDTPVPPSDQVADKFVQAIDRCKTADELQECWRAINSGCRLGMLTEQQAEEMKQRICGRHEQMAATWAMRCWAVHAESSWDMSSGSMKGDLTVIYAVRF